MSERLDEIDYVQENSSRISRTVQKVLRMPADRLKGSLETTVRELGKRREETVKTRKQSEVALKYFGNLARNSANQRDVVAGIDLESPPPISAEMH
jgi:mitofusin 2